MASPSSPPPIVHPTSVLGAYCEALVAGKRVAIIGDGTTGLPEQIADSSRRRVHVFDPQPSRAAARIAELGDPRESRVSYAVLDTDAELHRGAFDVVVVPDLALGRDPDAVLGHARGIVAGHGLVIVATRNPKAVHDLGDDPPTVRRDSRTARAHAAGPARDGAKRQSEPRADGGRLGGELEPFGYYELYDRVAAHFPETRMLGQAPFVGFTVADFSATEEPSVTIDTSLIDESEEPTWFLAIGSQRPIRVDPYVLLQVPFGVAHGWLGAPEPVVQPANTALLTVAAERERALIGELADAQEKYRREVELAEQRRVASAGASVRVAELEEQLRAAQGHAKELERRCGELERDSAAGASHELAQLQDTAAHAEARVAVLEEQLRAAQSRESSLRRDLAEREARPRREHADREASARREATEREAKLRREATAREATEREATEREAKLRREATEHEATAREATEREAKLRREATERDAKLRREATEREAKLRREATEREASLRRDATQREAKLRGEVEDLQGREHDLELALTESVDREAALEAELDRLQEQLVAARRPPEPARAAPPAPSERRPLEVAEAPEQPRPEQVRMLEFQIEELRKTLDATRSERDELRRELAAEGERGAELGAARATIRELEGRLAAAAGLETSADIVEAHEQELGALEGRLRERGRYVADLESRLREAQRAGRELLVELSRRPEASQVASAADPGGERPAEEAETPDGTSMAAAPAPSTVNGSTPDEAVEGGAREPGAKAPIVPAEPLDGLKQQLEVLAQRCSTHQADLEAARWTIAALRHELAQAQATAADHPSDHQKIEEALRAAQGELAHLRAQRREPDGSGGASAD